MNRKEISRRVNDFFTRQFGTAPESAAYAPGRVEILGNHTDYNEGFVLSAAIDFGTLFACSRAGTPGCRCIADLKDEAAFDIKTCAKITPNSWANYIIGVTAGLAEHAGLTEGFNSAFLGNMPLGAGLSSSAALEMSTGLALSGLYRISIDKITLAKIGQQAEHHYVGAKCGLLDQISSLYGKENELVITDFRTLAVDNVPIPEAVFLVCNTRVKHSLVESEYNERRASCEKAAEFFAGVLDRDIRALRDVSPGDLDKFRARMDPVAAKRAAHVIGENSRVLDGRKCLATGDLATFGRLMYQSHDSSRHNFENSCPELDFVVDTARKLPEVLGARLSGGGFGGSVVLLTTAAHIEHAGNFISSEYARHYGTDCDMHVIHPASGATIVD